MFNTEYKIPSIEGSESEDQLTNHINLTMEAVPGNPGAYYTRGFTDEFVLVTRPDHSTDTEFDLCVLNMDCGSFLSLVEEEEDWGEHYKLPVINGDVAYSILRELQYACLA